MQSRRRSDCQCGLLRQSPNLDSISILALHDLKVSRIMFIVYMYICIHIYIYIRTHLLAFASGFSSYCLFTFAC